MNGWMNISIDEGTNRLNSCMGWMDGWMDEWMDEWMDAWMDGWMNGWMNISIDEGTNRLIDGRTVVWDGWMDG